MSRRINRAHPMLARLTRLIEFTGKSAQLAVYGVFIVLAFARGAEDPKELLSLALRSPLERAGDYDALALSWLEAVPKSAADFRVELILRRLNSLRPFLRDEPALIAPLQSAMSAAFASGTMVEILRDMLLDLYRRTGRKEEEGRLVLNRGYLLHWLIIGPFGKGQSSPFQREFPPEEEQKIDATYRDDWQELAWRPIQSSARNPLVSFFDFTYPSSGVVYLLAQVKSPEDRQALLGRGTSDSLKVWLNGFLVADDDATQAYLENRRFTGVRLARGWNRILVKARRPFWIRLSDERGAPFPPDALREEDSREIHPVDGAGDPRWQGPSRADGPLSRA